MKRLLLTIICAFLVNSLQSQILKGIVKFQNKGGAPAEGLRLSSDGANQVYSDENGFFTLKYPNKKPGDKVVLSFGNTTRGGTKVRIINTKDITEIRLPSKPSYDIIEVVVAFEKEWMDRFQTYYGIIFENQTEEINQKLEENTASINRFINNSDKIEQLEKQQKILEKEKEEALLLARNNAKLLASVDRRQISEEVKIALKWLDNSINIDRALNILNSEVLISAEEVFSQNAEHLSDDAEILIEAYLNRIDFKLKDFNPQEIIKSYEAILGLYSASPQINYTGRVETEIAYADFLEDFGEYDQAIKVLKEAKQSLETYLKNGTQNDDPAEFFLKLLEFKLKLIYDKLGRLKEGSFTDFDMYYDITGVFDMSYFDSSDTIKIVRNLFSSIRSMMSCVERYEDEEIDIVVSKCYFEISSLKEVVEELIVFKNGSSCCDDQSFHYVKVFLDGLLNDKDINVIYENLANRIENQYDSCFKTLSIECKLKEEIDFYHDLINTMLDAERYDEALEYAKTLEKRLSEGANFTFLEKVRVLEKIALVYSYIQNYKKSIELYEKTLRLQENRLHPFNLDIAYNFRMLSWEYSDSKDYPKAKENAENAIKIYRIWLKEDDYRIVDLKKDLLFYGVRMNDVKASLNYFEDIYPNFLEESNKSRLYLSILKVRGKYDIYCEDAVTFWGEFLNYYKIELRDDDYTIRIIYDLISDGFDCMKNYDSAYMYYELSKVDKRYRQDRFTYINSRIARDLFDDRDYEDAIEKYEKLLEKSENNMNYLEKLGWSYYFMQDYDKALDYFLLIEIDPDREQLYLDVLSSIGLAYCHLNDHDSAEKYFKKVDGIYDDHSESDFGKRECNWAVYYSTKGNFNKAKNKLLEAVDDRYYDAKFLEEERSFDRFRKSKFFNDIMNQM